MLYDRSSDRYVPLDDELLQELTGRTASSFGVPWTYRVPLGWIVVDAVLAVGGFVMWRRMRELG